MSRSVLVLGGGAGQLSLLRHLDSEGLRVILQDRSPSCPGRPLAQDYIRADTFDAEAASLAATRFKVSAVLTAGTDQPVLAAALAARKVGCPALHTPETARRLTDKEAMKTALIRNGIPVPRCRFFGPEAGPEVLRDLRPPWVIKPVDSQGQRGVVRIETPEEFLSARNGALPFSRRGRLVAEEYHRHREVTVSGWVHRGICRIWGISDRVTKDFSPHIGLCMAHRYPSAYAEGREEEISRLAQACSLALGMEEGPLYHQFLVCDDGILVNECAGRLGGAYEEISLPPVCGTDPVRLLTDASIQGGADSEDRKYRSEKWAEAFSVPLMFCRPGKIHSLGNEQSIRSLPGVTEFSYLQKKGAVIRPLENSVQRAAYMVIHGTDVSAVNRTLSRAVSRIRVLDSEGRQLLHNPLGYAQNPR